MTHLHMIPTYTIVAKDQAIGTLALVLLNIITDLTYMGTHWTYTHTRNTICIFYDLILAVVK